MSRRLVRAFLAAAFLAALPVLLAGCEDKPKQQGGPPVVRYSVVQGQRLVLTTELPGRVSALMTSEVRPQVTGIIRDRLFEEGADVEAGQVLYQIDPALFQAAFNSAEADLQKARANEVSARLLAGRYGKIIKSNAVSRQEHDDAVSAYVQAKAAVEAARQALEAARINLDYTRVAAPVSGRISRSFVTPGALVIRNQSQALAVIQHMEAVYVDVSQSSTAVLRLRRALSGGGLLPMGAATAKVKLKLEDGTPYARPESGPRPDGEPDWIKGELLFADVTIEKSSGVVNIRAKFDNPFKALLPGMYVRAIFEEGVFEDAVLVPQRTVMLDTDGSAYVYVLERGGSAPQDGDTFTVARRTVKVRRNIGTNWLISSGLAPGDRVVLEGHLKTRPGGTVSGEAVAPAEPGSPESPNARREHAARPRTR